MVEERKDRRVQRTRLTLRSAMVELIREKGFEALTVQDIIDRADVGRSTFYSHFRSKEDLLAGSVAMLRSSLRKFQRQAIARTELNRLGLDRAETHLRPRQVGHDRHALAGGTRRGANAGDHVGVLGEVAVREIQSRDVQPGA